jgi:hypothetical protein
MPQILWTQYFLEAQGYDVKESIVNQDNQSAILLEKNGRTSSRKRTRHIHIRYFSVADRVALKEVSIQYCPTGEMVADFFTKPLQGALFKKFRNFIMNIDPPADRLSDHRSVLGSEKVTRIPCGRITDRKVRFGGEPHDEVDLLWVFVNFLEGFSEYIFIGYETTERIGYSFSLEYT